MDRLEARRADVMSSPGWPQGTPGDGPDEKVSPARGMLYVATNDIARPGLRSVFARPPGFPAVTPG